MAPCRPTNTRAVPGHASLCGASASSVGGAPGPRLPGAYNAQILRQSGRSGKAPRPDGNELRKRVHGPALRDKSDGFIRLALCQKSVQIVSSTASPVSVSVHTSPPHVRIWDLSGSNLVSAKPPCAACLRTAPLPPDFPLPAGLWPGRNNKAAPALTSNAANERPSSTCPPGPATRPDDG